MFDLRVCLLWIFIWGLLPSALAEQDWALVPIVIEVGYPKADSPQSLSHHPDVVQANVVFSKEGLPRVYPERSKDMKSYDSAIEMYRAASRVEGAEGFVKEMASQFEDHGTNTHKTFAMGDKDFRPVLMTRSDLHTDNLGHFIKKGSRVVNLSLAFPDKPFEVLQKVIKENPEVMFVFSRPHSHDPDRADAKELAEETGYFSKLAKLGADNVFYAGCVSESAAGREKSVVGKSLSGTRSNPIISEDHPTEKTLKNEYNMLGCEQVQKFAPGFGQSSAAAPVLSRLLLTIIEDLKRRGIQPGRDAVRAHLEKLMHPLFVKDALGKVGLKPTYTLNTVLANLGKDLVPIKMGLQPVRLKESRRQLAIQ